MCKNIHKGLSQELEAFHYSVSPHQKARCESLFTHTDANLRNFETECEFSVRIKRPLIYVSFKSRNKENSFWNAAKGLLQGSALHPFKLSRVKKKHSRNLFLRLFGVQIHVFPTYKKNSSWPCKRSDWIRWKWHTQKFKKHILAAREHLSWARVRSFQELCYLVEISGKKSKLSYNNFHQFVSAAAFEVYKKVQNVHAVIFMKRSFPRWFIWTQW